MVSGNPDRRKEIVRLVFEGMKRREIAEMYGISVGRVSQIFVSEQAKVPLRDRMEIAREHSAELDRSREILKEIIEAPGPVAMSQGKPVNLRDGDGVIIEGRYAEDVSARLAALNALVQTQKRQADLLGLNSPTQTVATEVVTVKFEGVDTEGL